MTDTSLLSSLHLPEDIPGLSLSQKQELAQELRDTIIRVVTKNGGHLAPSLGVVELTIALLSCFDPARDPIVWDVGHQSYPWKILTGRADRFDTLRRYGGLSGFPNRSESPYDYFGVGHASTSISAALGMAAARDLRGGKEHVVAVIGDGALSGGMALEALNQAGGMGHRLIVILNDNKMSISENTGALSRFLSRNLSHSTVMHIKQHVAKVLSRLPKGDSIVDIIRKGEVSFKSFFTPGMLFEAFQFNYIGPINGHDIAQLERHLEAAKQLDMPVLLHIRTRKGKGYGPAENDPSHFHGISASVADEISVPPQPNGWKPSGPGFSQAFGSTLCTLAEKNPRLFAITAAMPDGTGLQEFHLRFPERFADVGICEEHAVTFAAGLASRGYHPVVAIYSTFMQRAYDQIIHDVCLQNLPVTFCLDRAGLVGEDGPTHHGAFDLSWLRVVPNLTLGAPRDEAALKRGPHHGHRHGSARGAALSARIRAKARRLEHEICRRHSKKRRLSRARRRTAAAARQHARDRARGRAARRALHGGGPACGAEHRAAGLGIRRVLGQAAAGKADSRPRRRKRRPAARGGKQPHRRLLLRRAGTAGRQRPPRPYENTSARPSRPLHSPRPGTPTARRCGNQRFRHSLGVERAFAVARIRP